MFLEDVFITFQEFKESELIIELTELIDREAVLMVRGVKAKYLQGLRRRVNNLFLKFIKLPEVNPTMAKYFEVNSLFSIFYLNQKQICINAGCTFYNLLFQSSCQAAKFIIFHSWQAANYAAPSLFILTGY